MNVFDGNISFAQIANFAIAFVLVAGTILSIAYIAKGGISFITSGGEEENIKAAVHTVRYAIVGLIVIFLSILIIKVIGSIFGLDLLSYLSMEKIKGMIDLIIERLKATPNSGSEIQGILD